MALNKYKGGSNPAPDWEKDPDGFRLGRIKGDWEDKLHAAVPEHSERNWNHGSQMTERLGTTDGNIDSQAEVDAVAEWLRNNTPETEPEDPTPEVPVEPEPDIPIVHSKRYEDALNRVARWEDPEHPEYHDFANRIFNPDSLQADSLQEYDFSDDKFLAASNQALEEREAEESEAKANALLNSYKNVLIG